MVQDAGDKLTAADRSAIEGAIEELKKANQGTDAAAIQRALDQLTAAQHKAAESLYRQQAQPGPSGQAPGGDAGSPGSQSSAGAPKGDVIDAEVVDEGKP